jgi:general secretion pathway protein F
MPIFKYQGYKEDGSEIKGVIEADGQRDAALKIRAAGVFPKKIDEKSHLKKKIFSWKPLHHHLPDITRGLATMLSSGVPLIEAVGASASEQKGQWQGILIDIKERISSGSTLARATQEYPAIFPEFYSSIVSAGENSGKLPAVLTKLSDFLESQVSLKNKVQTSLIYPLFMGFVSIIILSFLFIFVVPKITKIFEETSAALPLITVLLIFMSNIFRKFWWLLLLLTAGAVLLYQWMRKNKREIIDSILLRLPISAFQSLYTARFSMTLSFLLSGGIPILKALKLSAKVTGNSVLENRIISAQNLVSQGAKLSSSLEGFSHSFLQILSTGEKSGQLAEVLEKAAVSYEADFDKKLQRAVGLMEPLLILFMGVIVGFIVIAILLPIFELNQLIK